MNEYFNLLLFAPPNEKHIKGVFFFKKTETNHLYNHFNDK